MSILARLAFRYLAGRPVRTSLTTLSIVLGVAVIFAVNALMPTMLSALEGSMLGVSGQVDLTISSASGETFSAAVLKTVKRTPGVAAASPALRRQITFPETPDAGGSPPQIELVGVDPATAGLVRQYQLNAGRFLNREEARPENRSAVVSLAFASGLRLGIGDEFTLPTPHGLVEFKVVGIVASHGDDQVLIPLPAAQNLFGQGDRINTIDLALATGSDREAVKRALESALGPGYNVGSAAMQSDAFANIQMAVVGLNFLGLLTLFMGGFLIFNTFRTGLIERQHDLGMLRAVGATRGMIVALVVIESAVQGLIGTALGLGLGFFCALGMAEVMQGVMSQYLAVRAQGLVVPPHAFVLAIGLGLGITLAAGLLPALGARKVSILDALRPRGSGQSEQRPRLERGPRVGLAILGLSVLGLVSGNSGVAGVSALTFLGGLVLVAPALIEPIARAFQPLLLLTFAREGIIAQGNVRRHPGRASITASAVMIGLAIIIATTGLFSSIEATFLGYLDRSLAADVILLPPSLGLWGSDVGLGRDFEQRLARTPGIGAWASLRYASSRLVGVRPSAKSLGGEGDETALQVLAFDPATYPKVSALTFEQGGPSAYAELTQGRNAIANPILANGAGLKVGDSVQIRTPEGPRAYRIIAIGNDYLAAKINTLYISQRNLQADFHKDEDILVMANLQPGANREEVKARLDALLEDYPQVTMHWGSEWRAEQKSVFSQYIYALYLILLVLVVPSLLGLINTLAIGVLERTREIGVLRAVGATRRQVQRLVLAESAILAAAGAAFGMLAGLALGYALTALLAATMTASFRYSFPLAGLIAALAVALLMAVVASLLPARQAARLQIVKALQYE